MKRRLAPWLAVGLACLVLVGVVIWRNGSRDSSSDAAIGGDFHLVDQASRPVDQTILKGKWTAVVFGYTYCPDVCPTTLTTLGGAVDALGPLAKNVQVVFITVDPRRDTPRQLKGYLSSAAFPKGTVGLTGTDQEIADAAKAYRVYFQKQGDGAGYSVDHSSAIYLMNPQGRFASAIAYGLTPDQTRDAILTAMRSPPTG